MLIYECWIVPQNNEKIVSLDFTYTDQRLSTNKRIECQIELKPGRTFKDDFIFKIIDKTLNEPCYKLEIFTVWDDMIDHCQQRTIGFYLTMFLQKCKNIFRC